MVIAATCIALSGAGISAAAAAANPYTVTARMGVGKAPYGVGVDPSTNTVYVTNEASGTVSVIDGATNTVTATIVSPVGAVGGAVLAGLVLQSPFHTECSVTGRSVIARIRLM
jgi:YVTN family beta-propeller protein